MSEFLNKLRELLEKATKGPWRPDEYEPRSGCWAIRGDNNVCDMFYLREDDHTRIEFDNGEANAALICLLVNHSEEIEALVEALERIEKAQLHHDDGVIDVDAVLIIQDIAAAALSRLESKS